MKKSKNRSRYLNHLKVNNLRYLKMTISSFEELLNETKRVLKGGKKQYRSYSESDFLYNSTTTKLGLFNKRIKSGNYSELIVMFEQLNSGTYPNKSFNGLLLERIDKPDKPRMIKVPAVTDRILFSLLLKRIEGYFISDIQRYPIYGLPEKGVEHAVNDFVKVSGEGEYILKLDFQGYFDTIPRGKLMNVLRGYGIPGEELALLKSSIHAPTKIPKKGVLAMKHAHKFKPYETKVGLPQGCSFSPILASIYALDIERYLRSINRHSVRYIDDIIIIAKSKDDARNIYKNIFNISSKLGLHLHKPVEDEVNDKSYICHRSNVIRFLGLDIYNGAITIPSDKLMKITEKIKEKSSQKLIHSEDINYRDDVICSYISGWSTYYKKQASHDWSASRDKIKLSLLNSINKENLDSVSILKIENTIKNSI